MSVLVIAPTSPEPLDVTSRWARELSRRLGSLLLTGDDATPDKVSAALESNAVSGLAFFGHGHCDRLCAQGAAVDEPLDAEALARRLPVLLDTTTIGAAAPGWVYALACLAGAALGPAAIDAGCEVFAGYDEVLRFPASFSNEEVTRATEPVILAACALAEGLRGEREIRRRLFEAVADSGLLALDDTRFWLVALMQQLLEVRVLSAVAAVHES